VADFRESYGYGITPQDLLAIGYSYDPVSDKWTIGDAAADYIYTGNNLIDFDLPGTLTPVCNYSTWLKLPDRSKYVPYFRGPEYNEAEERSDTLNFVWLDSMRDDAMTMAEAWKDDETLVLCCSGFSPQPMLWQRRLIMELMIRDIRCPIILTASSRDTTIDEQLIDFSAEAGALLLDGMGDGIWLQSDRTMVLNIRLSGRTYLEKKNNHQFLNNTSFSILQATRTRISKTEYISCPSCGRTLFDLQETTAKIRSVTHHLKGVKIAIMGCIVNGPGEMADADFGYVGSGPGKITLYKGKEIVKRGVDSRIAVEELIKLLKEHEAWTEPAKLTPDSSPTRQ
jgi:(E)-4-hydroxy-3-methylbut-2-enyl-diphosphate synthase